MLHTTFKGMLSHKMRSLLTAISIALGVAFLAGTLMLNDSMSRAFDSLFATVNSGTDVVVRAEATTDEDGKETGRTSLPANLLDDVRTADGVAVAEGSVEGYALLTDADGKPIQPPSAPTIGGSLPEDTALRGELTFRSGRAPERPGEVAIDATSAKAGDLRVGSRIDVLFQGPPEEFTVVGIVGFGEEDDLGGASSAYFDAGTAQRVLGSDGSYDSIVVRAEDGVSASALADELGTRVPEGVEALTGEEVAEEASASVKEGLGFLTIALTAFAGIALFVGSFIIWNAFSMQVAQRTRELALLRAIGATRAQVMRTILAEALLLALVASGAGIALGVGLARGLSALMDGFGISLPTAPLRVQLSTVVIGLLVGTTVTLVAAVAPARRATKVLPVEALRDAAPGVNRFSRRRLVIGLLLVGAGVIALLMALVGSASPIFIAVGVVAAVFGVTTLAPVLIRPMASVLGAPLRLLGVPGELAQQNAMRNPKRTAATAMALVIGLTMVAAVSVFAASMKASFNDVLASSTKADLYILTPSNSSPGFSPAVTDVIRDVEGVRTVSDMSRGQAEIDGKLTQFASIDPATAGDAMDLGMVDGAVEDLDDGGVLVHADVAEANGWQIGDDVAAAFEATGDVVLKLQGTYDTKGFLGADYVISGAAHASYVPDRLLNTGLVLLEDGVDLAAAERAVGDALAAHPDATVMDEKEFQGELGGLIDQLLGLVTVLLLLAVLIALLGIVNTLALSVFERTRELGLLRAVGMTRMQVRAMVRWESVMISVIGALMGGALGIGLGLALTRAMAENGIDKIAVPGGQLTLYVVAAAIAGVLAAVGPARRAAKVDVLRAVVSD
jgi:putative ABC transport system permease protein